jgi:lipid-binding SYLF domain-containing protein
MKTFIRGIIPLVAALLFTSNALAADPYVQTIQVFRKASESTQFFRTSYGYAVFPTIGKGGFGIGAAHGKGRVYEKGRLVGDVSMTQLSVGFQIGGQTFSEMIFFENKGAFDDFTSGNFEFGADVGAVAITAGANVSANTSGGTSAGASGGKKDAVATGAYRHGVAVLTIAKGGLMYQAAVQGQKFSYKPRGSK